MSDDIFDNIKRLKFFEEVLMAFGNNKLIFKDLNESNDHLTLKMREDGILDVHNTKEGFSKEYESLGKFDFTKVQDPQVFQGILSELLSIVKIVNFSESEFENCIIAVFPTKEEFSHFAKRKKKDVSIGLDDAKKAFGERFIIPWNEGSKKLKEIGAVYDKNSNNIGFILRIPTGFIFISLESMKNLSSKVMSMLDFDKNDSQRS